MSERRWVRAGLVVLALVVALNVGAAVLERLFPDPSGPPGSSYATAPEGLAAYGELLRREGRRVRALRAAPAGARLDPRATLILARPDAVSREDAGALRRFVERGGRLVAGGPSPEGWVEELLDRPPAWAPERVGRAATVAPVPETRAVGAVASTGIGSWKRLGGTLPALRGQAGRPLLTVAALGRGRLALLADTTPLENRTLAVADNAALALALAGDPARPVLFAESVHGFAENSGLEAIPPRWRFALGGLVLSALVLMLARGRRLGPPESRERTLAPPRADYAIAMAGALAKSGRPGEAVEPVRAAARRRLGARAGLGHDALDEHLRHAAGRAGLAPEEVRAVVDGVGDERGALAAGRALARLSGDGR
jgi:hypothetical protein